MQRRVASVWGEWEGLGGGEGKEEGGDRSEKTVVVKE